MFSKYGNCTRLLKIKTSWKLVVFTNKVGKNSGYFLPFFIKQLFHSRLLNMRWLLGAKVIPGKVQAFSVHIVVVEKLEKKCTNKCDARAKLLFCL